MNGMAPSHPPRPLPNPTDARMKPIPLVQQIASAKRELAMRERVYPKWVEARKMTEAAASHEIECMRAIVATLEAQQTKQPTLF